MQKYLLWLSSLCILSMVSCKNGLIDGLAGQYTISVASVNGLPISYQSSANYCTITKESRSRVAVNVVLPPQNLNTNFSNVEVTNDGSRQPVKLYRRGNIDYLSGTIDGKVLEFEAMSSQGDLMHIKAIKN